MSLAHSTTTFVIDISATMGRERKLEEELLDSEGNVVIRKRNTTDLAWACEFVSRKLQALVLAGLKTAKACVITYGSPRTNNAARDNPEITEGYEGIDEIYPINNPDIRTLDMVRNLCAVSPDEGLKPGDPLDALVAAISTMTDPSRGGTKPGSKHKKIIYLITDARNPLNTADSQLIKDKIVNEDFHIRLLGIDFDDENWGFKEEDKDETKASNERFWHKFLAEVPNAQVATAAQALYMNALPEIQLKSSAAVKTTLTFGDPDDVSSRELLRIPVNMYKLTSKVSPMSQTKLSKVAQESAAGKREWERMLQSQSQAGPSSVPSLPPPPQEEDDMPTYLVDRKMNHYLTDALFNSEDGTAEPLAEDTEFEKAYKLGATLVPVSEDMLQRLQTKKGLEIIQFVHASTYAREYHFGEVYYVFAEPGSQKAQIQLSSVVKALSETDELALVRLVQRDEGEPKIGILSPVVTPEYDCFHFIRVPFAQDVRRYVFAPLDRVVTKEGTVLHEHRNIPTAEQQDLMDHFVDSMDLMEIDEDEEGNKVPWFEPTNSFNPAVHRIKEAVLYKILHPDADVPSAHHELTKYFNPPKVVLERSAEPKDACKTAFQLRYIPPKAHSTKRSRANAALDKEGGATQTQTQDLDLTDAGDTQGRNGGAGRSEGDNGEEGEGSNKKVKLEAESGASDTEEEEDLLSSSKPRASRSASASASASASQAKTRPQRSKAGARTISLENPVADFERLVEGSEDVDQACEAMRETIRELVNESMSTSLYDKARDALSAFRNFSAEYDEAIQYNRFLTAFKSELHSRPSGARSRTDFWQSYIRGKRELGLITAAEDEGGRSEVGEKEAMEFVEA